MLISFVATPELICVFVFAYAKHWFSHDAAHISFNNYVLCDNYCFIGVSSTDGQAGPFGI